MDNGSFDMSEGQVVDMVKRATRPAVSLLKELYELCKRTRVTHGHGDYGDPLDYYGDLEGKVQRTILDHLEQSNDGAAYDEFALFISHGKDIYIGQSGPQHDSYFATVVGAYKYNEYTRRAIKIIVQDCTFDQAWNAAKAYRDEHKRSIGSDLYNIVGASKECAVMIRAKERQG